MNPGDRQEPNPLRGVPVEEKMAACVAEWDSLFDPEQVNDTIIPVRPRLVREKRVARGARFT